MTGHHGPIYMGESADKLRVRYQQLMNSHPIPDRRLQRRWPGPKPVLVRLDWQRSGEERRETFATHWARVDGVLLVLVEVLDPRRKTKGAWLARADVEPIESPQQ